MSDNILSAVLTFGLMAAGTAAIGSEMWAISDSGAALPKTTLPTVTVVGKRIAAADTVILPTVVVTGRRHLDTEVAVDDTAARSRVE